MENFNFGVVCPQCSYPHLKTWDELTSEEKFIAERLPASADDTVGQRKKHRFCTRCWFESKDSQAWT